MGRLVHGRKFGHRLGLGGFVIRSIGIVVNTPRQIGDLSLQGINFTPLRRSHIAELLDLLVLMSDESFEFGNAAKFVFGIHRAYLHGLGGRKQYNCEKSGISYDRPMSKAFTKEGDGDNTNEDDFEEIDPLPPNTKNLMTPFGHKVLSAELEQLVRFERPKIVEIVSWAAGNGDRSENGDYLYNKKKLREIDRRLRYLTKRLETAEVVDPKRQQGIDRVFFGATVTYVDENDTETTVKLVGVDEADMDHGKINWVSPVARALMKATVGDSVDVRTVNGIQSIEIIDIVYEIDGN